MGLNRNQKSTEIDLVFSYWQQSDSEIAFCHAIEPVSETASANYHFYCANPAFYRFIPVFLQDASLSEADFLAVTQPGVNWPFLFDQAYKNNLLEREFDFPDQKCRIQITIRNCQNLCLITRLQEIPRLKGSWVNSLSNQSLVSQVFYKNSLVGCMIVSPEMKILDFNEKAKRNLELYFSKQIQKGMSVFNFVAPADMDGFRMHFKRCLAGENIVLEKQILYGDSLPRWYAFEFQPLIGSGGETEAVSLLTTDIERQKEEEQQRLKLEDANQLFSRNTLDVFWRLNARGRLTFVSSSVQRLLGYTEDQIKQLSVKFLFSSEELQRVSQWLKSQSEEGGTPKDYPVGLETRMLHSRGYEIPVELFANIIRSEGQSPMVEGVVKDISKRKRLEQNLMIQASAMDHSPLSIMITNNEGVIDYVNPRYSHLTGYPAEEVLGQSLSLLYQAEELDVNRREILAMMEKGQSWVGEFKNTRKSGEQYYESAIVVPVLDGNRGATHYVIISEDITHRKVMLEVLKESEGRFRQLADNIDEVFWLRTADQMLYINKAFERIWGVPCRNIYENPEVFLEFVHPEDQQRLSENLVEKKRGLLQPHLQEYRIIRPDGEVRWIESVVYPVEQSREVAKKTAGIARDITERKRGEQEMVEARAKAEEGDRLKAAFLRNISHEIRTPMNAILGFTQLLKMPDLTRDKQETYLSTITTASDKLLEIVEDIMTISRLESGEVQLYPERLAARDIVRQLFSQNKERESASVEFTHNIQLAGEEVFADNARVMTILEKLLSNAFKFTSVGFIELGCLVVKANVRFYVKDTGIGIDSRYFESIFEPFRQVETDVNRLYEGSGIGLSIASRLALIMGSEIKVESRVGLGSLFYFDLPVAAPKAVEPVLKPETATSPALKGDKQYHILVADDEELNFMLLEELITAFFRGQPLQILCARNGEEAVNLCREYPEMDLVLMDIKMPILDGLEATRIIKSFMPQVPVIAQTALAMAEDFKRIQEAGCDASITKPIQRKQLEELLKHFL